MPIQKSAAENAAFIKSAFHNSFDLQIRAFTVAGAPAAAVFLDGMCDEMKIAECVLKPLTNKENFSRFGSAGAAVKARAYKGMGLSEETDLNAVAAALTEGFLALFLENEAAAFLFSMQGFPKKGIDTPEAEQNELGGSERFADSFKDNVTLLRRRLKTPALVTERTVIGETSRTDVIFCYLEGRADPAMLQKVKQRLAKTGLDTLLGSGYLKPFLDGSSPSLFSDTGFTERPDMLAAKLAEGRIGVIADGTPYALIAPYLFIDYFHSLDDYMGSPAYALFLRLLRLACFFISAALPGLFVATCDFHPEVLPPGIMLDIAAAEAKTPFSLAFEAFAIHLIYEIVREAGLRMPVAVGHAVSIVGALVVGDAAVTAGLIAAPMLMVVALTAISSAVIPKLHEPLALLRFGLIALGGLTGFFGVFIAMGLLLSDLCGGSPYGVPFSAPFSPFVRQAQRDALRRAGWRTLGRTRTTAREMKFE